MYLPHVRKYLFLFTLGPIPSTNHTHSVTETRGAFIASRRDNIRRIRGAQSAASYAGTVNTTSSLPTVLFTRRYGLPVFLSIPSSNQRELGRSKPWHRRLSSRCPLSALHDEHQFHSPASRLHVWANTDITIVTRGSIAEYMYVCSYAVKADKTTLFDARAHKRLRDLGEGTGDDRKIFSSIARAEGFIAVRSQEAVDNLLGNPLTFQTAKILDIST